MEFLEVIRRNEGCIVDLREFRNYPLFADSTNSRQRNSDKRKILIIVFSGAIRLLAIKTIQTRTYLFLWIVFS